MLIGMFALTTKNLSFSLDATGLRSVTFAATKTTFNLSAPAGGNPQQLRSDPNYPPAAGTQPLGALISSDIGQFGNEVGITQVYAGCKAQWFFRPQVATDDLRVEVTLTPTGSLPFSNIILGLPTFQFGSQPAGNLHFWDITACAQNIHPSFWNPLGCVYAFASDLSVCIHPHTSLGKQTLINASPADTGVIPQIATLTLYVTDCAPPGQSITVGYTLRFKQGDASASNAAFDDLTSTYVTDMTAFNGPMKYIPGPRGAWPMPRFTSFDQSLVTPSNPYGYNGPARRFDLPSGPPLFNAMIAPVAGCAQGTMLWQPQGWQTGGAQYRPDFDRWPAAVAANLPAVIAWHKASGLRAGVQSRPLGILSTTSVATADAVGGLYMDDTAMLGMVAQRFANMMKLGVSMSYCDSMGSDWQSYQMLQFLSPKVGPNFILLTEQASDLTVPYAGIYTDLFNPATGGTRYYDKWVLRLFRKLAPNGVFTTIVPADANNQPTLTAAQLGAAKLVPMFEDFQCASFAPLCQAVVSQFTTNGQWNP
jgi:hypothetical protein